MNLILLLKPIADMLFEYQVLDIILVLGVIIVTLSRIKSTKMRWALLDTIIVILGFLFFLSYLRDTNGVNTFVKIESGFLLYFAGRMTYSKAIKNQKYLMWGFLIVLLITAFSFINKSGFIVWGRVNTFRGYYFFKTDLAAAMAQLFAIFAIIKKRSYINYAILGISSYFVFISNARMYYFVIVILVLFFFLYLREEIYQVRLRINTKLMLLGIAVLIGMLFGLNYLNQMLGEEYLLIEFQSSSDLVGNANTQGRSVAWENILEHFFNQPFWDRFWGLDLISDEKVGIICNSHNLYIKVLYSTGYLGCSIFILYIIRIIQAINNTQSAELYYLTLSFFAIYILSGISYITIESTQLTWLFMYYIGACQSEGQFKQPSKPLIQVIQR